MIHVANSNNVAGFIYNLCFVIRLDNTEPRYSPALTASWASHWWEYPMQISFNLRRLSHARSSWRNALWLWHNSKAMWPQFLPGESIGWEHDHISGPVSRKAPLRSRVAGPPSGLADGENIPCMEDKVSVSHWPRFDLGSLLPDSAWPFPHLSPNVPQLILSPRSHLDKCDTLWANIFSAFVQLKPYLVTHAINSSFFTFSLRQVFTQQQNHPAGPWNLLSSPGHEATVSATVAPQRFCLYSYLPSSRLLLCIRQVQVCV